MNSLRTAFLFIAAAAAVSPLNAAVTVYTSQSAFDAAVNSEISFGFDEGNSSDHYHVASNPYIQSGITLAGNTTAADTANDGTPAVLLIGNAATPSYGKDFLSFQNTDVGISADITASGVTALGFNYATYVADGAATVTVNGATPTAITVTGAPAFIGFTSTTPITDVSILFPTGYSFDLTSLSYGLANPSVAGAVPEPASWAMLIVGFGLVGGSVRRRRAGAGLRHA